MFTLSVLPPIGSNLYNAKYIVPFDLDFQFQRPILHQASAFVTIKYFVFFIKRTGPIWNWLLKSEI